MFDDVTRQLIANAPNFGQFDNAELADRLSRLFVRTASARLALTSGESLSEDFLEELEELRHVAMTYAAFVANQCEGDSLESVSYVAGTTFRILVEASAIGRLPSLSGQTYSSEEVPDSVVACVLLLLAGYPADAMHVASLTRQVELDSSDASRTLHEAICHIAGARLPEACELADKARGDRQVDQTGDVSIAAMRDKATELLWNRLTEGVGQLAAELLRGSELASRSLDATSIFEEVIGLSSESISESLYPSDSPAISNFSGPYFLASLLRQLGNTLSARGVVNVGPPAGVQSGQWQEFVQFLAKSRPLIWSNHRAAIDQGFLDSGTSAVMSFPTGAGKSTISEMKIATYIHQGKKAIFLAPTHALSHQVHRSLKKSFPGYRVHDSIIGDGFYSAIGEESHEFADITVMTPERCLMLMDIHREAFHDVALVVMDECHLLHPSRGIDDRRAIDAMLALLRVTDAAPRADIVLLSAMMSNADELAEWINSSLGRHCIALDLKWKPTRQARGCLVFSGKDLDALDARVAEAYQVKTTKGPPAALRRQMRATPEGLFSLHSTWDSSKIRHYQRCKVVQDDVALDVRSKKDGSTGEIFWELFANKNGVASQTAAEFAGRGVKTIVFSQSKPNCESITSQVDNAIDETVAFELTGREQLLQEAAVKEAGSVEHAYLPTAKGVVCHHGLLTPVERVLAERVFSRVDGGKVIVATPTLAQGMNLPAEAVILAGTHRYNETENVQELMQAHDLLNATGRSGRAGYRPEGVVLLVTDELIGIRLNEEEGKGRKIGSAWGELKQEIFSKDDQCLSIEDPVALLLDAIYTSTKLPFGTPSYFVNRLPLPDVSTEDARQLLSRSLGAFQFAKKDLESTFEAQIERSISAREELMLERDQIRWEDRVASTNGVSAIVLQSISAEFPDRSLWPSITVDGWVDFAFSWASRHPVSASRIFDRKATQKVVGKLVLPQNQEELDSNSINWLYNLFKLFLSGETLSVIEQACPEQSTQKRKLGFCTRARTLVQRNSLDVSILVGLFPQIAKEMTPEAERREIALPLPLVVASACARNGLINPEQLALSWKMRSMEGFPGEITRCQIHHLFKEIEPFLAPSESSNETFTRVGERVSAALIDSAKSGF